MSDAATPRTDAVVAADYMLSRGWKDRLTEHARTLERDLAGAVSDKQELEGALTTLLAALDEARTSGGSMNADRLASATQVKRLADDLHALWHKHQSIPDPRPAYKTGMVARDWQDTAWCNAEVIIAALRYTASRLK